MGTPAYLQKTKFMKRTITVFGLIAGVILAAFLFISMPMMDHADPDSLAISMFVNYTVQFLTFSLIFFAIRQYRDKYNNGIITFGKGFRIGLGISLIGSLFYILAWAIIYTTILPDFMDTYGRVMTEAAIKKGASAAEIAEIQQEVADGKAMYSTWYGFAGITLMEIFPTGLIVSLISALILKRNGKKAVQMA